MDEGFGAIVAVAGTLLGVILGAVLEAKLRRSIGREDRQRRALDDYATLLLRRPWHTGDEPPFEDPSFDGTRESTDQYVRSWRHFLATFEPILNAWGQELSLRIGDRRIRSLAYRAEDLSLQVSILTSELEGPFRRRRRGLGIGASSDLMQAGRHLVATFDELYWAVQSARSDIRPGLIARLRWRLSRR